MGLLIIALTIIIIVILIKYTINENKIENDRRYYNRPIEIRLPYHKKYLLTKHEYYFYKNLKQITDKYDLQILTKIRLADLVEVNKGLSRREWGMYFGKIKSKHVDFAIADNMKIVLIIELDDRTHQYQNRIERDMFVDDVMKVCGYYIIHTYGDTTAINNALNEYVMKFKTITQ